MPPDDAPQDIEDILLKEERKHDTSSTTVRIRKIRNKPVIISSPPSSDLSRSDCCSNNPLSCSCSDGLVAPLFDQWSDDNHQVFHNKVVVEEQEEEKSNDPLPQLASNDLNPASYTIYLKTWGCSHNNSDSEYMGGLLARHGFNVTTTDYESSSLVLLNSCTVKGPSEQHFKNEITRATSLSKHVVLAGCVPQSDINYRKLASSVIGVQQIDRIVEVVEETLKGNKLVYTSAKKREGRKGPGADLNLPKIRKNELIEIIAISTGCLNNCTYCKTKLARGQLASYTIDSIVERINRVCADENIREIWLTSEDLGAYGIDLGTNIVELLRAIVAVLPPHVMLRLGMTNPPYILDHLKEIAEILSHPNVYEFLHIPVQSGSDSVLLEMKREYSRNEFQRICDFMLDRLPRITLATDIICGYPTETDSDFQETLSLVSKYRFPVLFMNQFYPRPGTPAAKLKRIPTEIVKSRTRQLNELFQSYTNMGPELIGTTQRVLVTELAHDKLKFVGHNKSYQQVLVDLNKVHNKPSSIVGEWVDVKVVGVTKFSMIGGDAWVVNNNTAARDFNQYFLGVVFLVIVVVMFCSLFGAT